MKHITFLILILILSCTQRENDIGTQSNPFDPSGDNWTSSQAPQITFNGSDTLYWQNFDFEDSTGKILLPVTISDVDGAYDSYKINLLVGTQPTNLDTVPFQISPNGFLIDSLKAFNTYFINLIVTDSKNSSDTLDTLLYTPNGYPPIVPDSLSISASYTNITINWINNSSSDSIIIFKSSNLDSHFTQIAQVYDTSMISNYDNSYKISYYLVASKNKYGMNISDDTLITKSYSEICSIDPYWNGTPAANSITIEWYSSNSEIDFFEVYRSEYQDKYYTKISEFKYQTSNNYNYTDYNITTTKNFYYKISYTLKNGGASSLSQYATGYTIRLDAPTNISASQGTYGQNILITWDPVYNAKEYGILRSFQPDYYTYIDTVLLDTSIIENQYIDTPPTDTTYAYGIYAIDSSGNMGEIAWTNYSYPGYTLKYAKNFQIDTNNITDSTIDLFWEFKNETSYYPISIILKFTDLLMSDTIIDTFYSNSIYNSKYKDSIIDTNYSTYYYKVAQLDTTNKKISKFSDLLSAKAAPKPIYKDSVQITSYPDSAVLKWNKIKGADNYLIFRSSSNSYSKSDYAIYDSTTDTTKTITESLDSIYYYKIIAKNIYVESKWISEYGIEVKTLSIPDSGNVYSTSTSYGIQIYFSGFDYATSYNLYRSLDSLNNYSLVKTSDTSFFIDTVVTADKYYYKVTGVNLSGEGGFSNVVYGTRTKPGTAQNLIASQGTLAVENIIQVTWDTIAGADTIYILRAEGNQYNTYSIIDTILEQEYFDTVTTDTLYFYKVRGKNVVGFGNESSYSNGGFRKPSSVPDSVINVSTYSGKGQVQINWQIPSTGSRCNGFIIYRMDNDSIISNIEQNPIDTMEATTSTSYNFFDTNATFPEGFGKHWYIIKSYNIIGLSPPSEPIFGNIQ